MAKKNKSAVVRELLKSHPEMSAKDIAAKAGVTPNLVYFLKAKGKAKVRKAKRQAVARVAASNTRGQMDVVALLSDIKALAEKAGGIKELKKYVDVLAE
jgi:hypothetical protein